MTMTMAPDGAGTASNPLEMAEGLLQAGLVILLGVTLLVLLIRLPLAALRRRKAPPAG